MASSRRDESFTDFLKTAPHLMACLPICSLIRQTTQWLKIYLDTLEGSWPDINVGAHELAD